MFKPHRRERRKPDVLSWLVEAVAIAVTVRVVRRAVRGITRRR